jgi:hypothetical protein
MREIEYLFGLCCGYHISIIIILIFSGSKNGKITLTLMIIGTTIEKQNFAKVFFFFFNLCERCILVIFFLTLKVLSTFLLNINISSLNEFFKC